MQRATTLSEISRSCDPRPLKREELPEFFVDTSDARDPMRSRRDEMREHIEERILNNPKVLLVGHGGCGKSTELVKMADELSARYLTVSFSVLQECNLVQVRVEDLLLIIMERLLHFAHDAGLDDELGKAEKTLETIHQWFARELNIKEDETQAGAEAEAGVDTSGTLLARVFSVLVKAKTFIRRADKRLHKMTYEKPHRIGELTERCNLLIRSVKQALHTRQQHLLIVVEDLDKASLVDARRIFLEQPTILADLDAAVVCTVPIFLLHSPDHAALEQRFATIELPMLKVLERDASPATDGRAAIRKIVLKRVDDSLIEEDAFELLIEKSGGVLRDVFEALVIAAGAARQGAERGRQKAVITSENLRYGLNRRKTEYARAISTIDLPTEWKMSVNDLYQKLQKLRGRPCDVLPSEPITMVLLKSRAVIEYNGKGWYALHPLVDELLEVMHPS